MRQRKLSLTFRVLEEIIFQGKLDALHSFSKHYTLERSLGKNCMSSDRKNEKMFETLEEEKNHFRKNFKQFLDFMGVLRYQK